MKTFKHKYGMKHIALPVLFSVCMTMATSGAFGQLQETASFQKQRSTAQASAATVVKGKVVNSQGEELPGAIIMDRQNMRGVNSDLEGYFEIGIDGETAVLEIAFIGFKTKNITAQKGKFYQVVLQEDTAVLNEVVVTALGIQREEKQLGYAQQTIKSDDLENARSNNWSDALKGKVAGLSMLSANSGPMNSTQIKLRGDRSIEFAKNGALVVVDGTIVNSDLWSSGANEAYIGTDAPVDFGNGIADINPDDIESISVLKGPGAAALYGARAANGVLMITTKSGKESDSGLGITYSSNVTFDHIQNWPDYQYEYGQGTGNSLDKNGNMYYSYGASEDGSNTGSTSSAFGPKFDGQYFYQYDPELEGQGKERTLWRPYTNNIKDFWRTGMTLTNSLSFSGGNKKGNMRTTITHSQNEWIMPNTGFDRTTLSNKSNYQISDKIKLSTSVSYSNRSSDNLPSTGYGNHTIAYFMIFQNPNVDLDWYKPIWKKGNYQTEQIHPFSSYIENPYLIAYETTNGVNTNTVVGNFKVDFDLTENLKLMVRSALNSRSDKRELRRPFNTSKFGKGYFSTQQINFQEVNTDFLLSYENTDKSQDFLYSISLGGNSMDHKYHSVTNFVDGLVIPGVYTLSNGIGSPITRINDRNKKVNSLYGMVSFGYKNMIFVDATLRNDWSSTLPSQSRSFSYPSVNTSFILSDIFRLPLSIDYSKLRFSYAQVGNDTDPFRTELYYSNSDFSGSVSYPTMLHNAQLKPEITTSYEVGFEQRMFNNRLRLDATVYQTHSENQIIRVPLDYVTGYSSAVINSGNVRNRGIELVLGLTPIKTKDFTWETTFNWAKNQNRIMSLAEGMEGGDEQVLASSGTVSIVGKVGGTTGDMYGFKFLRNEEGTIIYNEQGLPARPEEIEYVGSAYADWSGGWMNTFRYKNLRLSVTLDGQYGGIVYSQTHHKMSEQGKLKHTLKGREEGYIIGQGVVQQADGSFAPNTVKVTPAAYYADYYRRANVESNSFDATYVKLREVSLEYSFSKEILKKLRIKKMSVGLFGRNLLTWSDFPIFDPETAALNGGGLVPGVEMGQLPSPATYGFNLKLEI